MVKRGSVGAGAKPQRGAKRRRRTALPRKTREVGATTPASTAAPITPLEGSAVAAPERELADVRTSGSSTPANGIGVVPRGAPALRQLAPGVIVAVWVAPVWHEGIVSDRHDAEGLPLVISCSRRAGRACEEPWGTFAPEDCPIAVVGYPSRLRPRTVLARARAGLGREWTPTRNCEHFARSCHGMPESPTAELLAAAAHATAEVVTLAATVLA